jgi:hypothetical protein
MFREILALALFATSIEGTNIYAPVHDFGAMLRRGDAILKRQGYYPTTHLCGEGETCAEACGATYVQCPSTSGTYCYDPTVGDHCCRDGSGSQSYPPHISDPATYAGMLTLQHRLLQRRLLLHHGRTRQHLLLPRRSRYRRLRSRVFSHRFSNPREQHACASNELADY